MQQPSLQKVSPEEVLLLQKTGRETFYESFAAVNTAEDMNSYLDQSFSSERLSAELSDPKVAYYFARMNGEVAGYLKLNFGAAQTDIRDDNTVEIERIYVKKVCQSRSIGQVLLDKTIEVARQRGADYIWLGVWEENRGAIRFYERNGFVVFGKHDFMLGKDRQTDLLMRKELLTSAA